MSRLRLIAIVFVSICAFSGLPAALHGATAESQIIDLTTVIKDLGVCGPIQDPFLDFTPRTADGKFDFERFGAWPDDAGTWRITAQVPEDLAVSLAGQQPTLLDLYEFQGNVQAAALGWHDLGQPRGKVFKSAVRKLKSTYGRPGIRKDEAKGWINEFLRIVIWEDEEEDSVTLLVACHPSEEAYNNARDTARIQNEAEDKASNPNVEGFGPNPWLDRSIVSVLLSSGAPDEAPLTPVDGVVGLHYTEIMGPGELPTEWWWWFRDGKAVYAAGDFLPPSGSKRARSSYQVFRKGLRGFFGEPTKDDRDPETGTERVIYETGPQLFILTYFDPDGDPWFRIECFDTTRLDELPDELRPNRKLPKRFTPPRKDSGLTVEDLREPTGAG